MKFCQCIWAENFPQHCLVQQRRHSGHMVLYPSILLRLSPRKMEKTGTEVPRCACAAWLHGGSALRNFSTLRHHHMHFFSDLSIPPHSQPLFPSHPLHCAGTAVCLAVGGPGVGRSSWRGGRAAYGSSSSFAAERATMAQDPHKVLRRQEGLSEPPLCWFEHSVDSRSISDAVVW